jgi:hypothetical protein
MPTYTVLTTSSHPEDRRIVIDHPEDISAMTDELIRRGRIITTAVTHLPGRSQRSQTIALLASNVISISAPID